jgi:hypothetical protein
MLASNLLYFGAPALMAWAAAARLAEPQPPLRKPRRRLFRRLLPLLMLLLSTLLYWRLGVYFTESVGAHSGDEGHYLVQARSLYHDHDLDIRNNLGEAADIAGPSALHVSPHSRHGKWYSWHPPGLAFLLAPTEPGGVEARHLALGLVAGLGMTALYLLCLRLGAAPGGTALALLFLGGSVYWGIYASRALPEVLGASLAIAALLTALTQDRFPWCSAVLAAFLCTGLAWAHTRFIPLAVTLAGCYGLQGLLLHGEPWPRRLLRLTVFTLLSLLGAAGYLAFAFAHFRGGSGYPVQTLLFSAPIGLWHALASSRGILYAFPVFACALAACIVLLTTRRHGLYPAFALLCFLSIYLTSCSTPYTGGSSLSGRHFVVVVPILMAGLACVLPGAGPGFRALACYLGLLSVCALVEELTVLERFFKSFNDPLRLDVAHPMFRGLLRPLYNRYETLELLPAALLYPLALVLGVVPRLPRAVQTAGLTALAAVTIACGLGPALARRQPCSPGRTAWLLEQQDLQRCHVNTEGRTAKARSLMQFSNRLYGEEPRILTTERSGDVHEGLYISAPRLPVNDWAGRGYRWATLAEPFSTGKGTRALHLVGELTGDIAIELAIREGSHTRITRAYAPGSRIDDTLIFDAEDTGHLYILARISDGSNGTFICRPMQYSPVSRKLLTAANLVLPTALNRDHRQRD